MEAIIQENIDVLIGVYRSFMRNKEKVDFCEGFKDCPLRKLFPVESCRCVVLCKASIDNHSLSTIQKCLVSNGYLTEDMCEKHNQKETTEFVFLNKDGYRITIEPPE